jgi:hypothetical protein
LRCLRRDFTSTVIPSTKAIAAIPRKIQVKTSDPRKIAFDQIAIKPIAIKRSDARVSLLFIPESNHDDAAVISTQAIPQEARPHNVP